MKDKIFGFVAFNPEWNDQERKINYYVPDSNFPGLGVVPFSRNQQTYYTTARVDAAVSQKVRVFGSWLYQYQRENGVNLPASDSATGLFNLSIDSIDPTSYPHSVGYVAPNVTINFGADFTITPRLVATTRFGYYFENYGDRGYPTDGNTRSSGRPTVWTARRSRRTISGQSAAGLVTASRRLL